MFPIFHIALPLLIFEIPRIKERFKVNRFALLIGSIIPDIIGKPLLFLKLDSGRGFSHSLLFIVASFLFLFLVTKGNTVITFSFQFGVITHFILDLPHLPWLYPFVSYDYEIIDDPIAHWIKTMVEEPIVSVTEILGAFILIFIIYNNKLYRFKEITRYLNTKKDHEHE